MTKATVFTALSRQARATLVIGLVAAALCAVGGMSLALGQVPMSLTEVWTALVGPHSDEQAQFARTVVVDVRMPRLLLGIGVGVGLGVAGVLMQSLFANPLAEPGVVGVSAGAATGAAIAIAWGAASLGQGVVSLAAFSGAILVSVLVVTLSRSRGRVDVVMLLLTGIALNALAGAVIAFVLFSSTSAAREQIVFWQFGSLNGAQWNQVGVVFPVVCAGVLCSVLLSRRLDVLSLGQSSAAHAGVNVPRTRVILIVIVAMMVGTAVAFAGIIGFVGLVIPHVMRILIGPAHGLLIIASGLGGALLVAGSDLIARTAVAFGDLPIGMVTAFLGAPVFLWLIRKISRDTSGGKY